MTKNIDKHKCNFCGDIYTEEELLSSNKTMIQSPLQKNVAICNDCVEKCENVLEAIVQSTVVSQKNKKDKVNITPSSIKKHLDEWIIGQEKAKRDLSTAVYNHYKMINTDTQAGETEIEKSNVLLVGPTGVGKTAIIKALGKFLNVPYTIADANSLTQSGYVGRDVEDMLRDLLDACDGNLDKAQNGIIYMDEIDKIGRKGANPSGQRDVSGEGVQQALLKLVEGGVFEVMPGGSKRRRGLVEEPPIKFDTSKVLFIAGGSFETIEKTVQERLNKKAGATRLGFSGNLTNVNTDEKFNSLITQVNPEDLKNFGMLPELLGRFPIVTSLEQLTEEAMVSILTEPKNALLKQYARLFSIDNIELDIEEDAIRLIAKKALEKKIGARALRATVEEALKDTMFIAPDIKDLKKIVITKKAIEDSSCTKFLIGEELEETKQLRVGI